MKKRVLQVTGTMNIGGTETMLMNLYRKINKDIQFDFISYSKEDGYYDNEIKELGGNIIKLNPPNEVGIINAIKDIKNVIKENGPYNVVHTHMMFNSGVAMIAAYLSEVKIRVSHAHTTADEGSGIKRKIYINIMRTFTKLFSTDFLACSNLAGKYLFGEGIINNKNYKILPNYIDYEKFIHCNDKTSIREELGIRNDDIVICHIGRFIKAKNHDFLIKIAKEMIDKNNKVKFILVGDGDLKNEIKNKVKELKIDKNIFFTGVRKDIPNILKNSNLFILPSIYEGLGLVLLEAQSSNIPCLVSEAIQPEVDLNLGLVKTLKIGLEKSIWAKEAEKFISKYKNIKDIEIENKIKEKNYDLQSILNILFEIYK